MTYGIYTESIKTCQHRKNVDILLPYFTNRASSTAAERLVICLKKTYFVFLIDTSCKSRAILQAIVSFNCRVVKKLVPISSHWPVRLGLNRRRSKPSQGTDMAGSHL